MFDNNMDFSQIYIYLEHKKKDLFGINIHVWQQDRYRVAKTHRMPYLYRSLSAIKPCD